MDTTAFHRTEASFVPAKSAGVIGCVLFVFLIYGRANATSPQPPDATHEDVLGSTKVNPKDGLTYVWIAPGSFQMGCSPGDRECSDGEKPRHTVTIAKGFWIGQTLVTQAAYQRVSGNNPSHFQGDRLPVDSVTWDKANAYCASVGMRLPTEAEWEYIARAGSTKSRYGDLNAIAWYADNSGNEQIDSAALYEKDPNGYQNRMAANNNRTHEVGQKPANAWNLYDMLGNVWQWTNDWYDETYYRRSPSRDPQGPKSGESRVVRGGTWAVSADMVRVSFRGRDEPSSAYYTIGFRCAGELRR
jgi:formylglycine-generating enzyme required for sulfatase activity